MTNRSEVFRRWQLLRPYLNRCQRSLWAAAEAEAIGYGGWGVLFLGTRPSLCVISGGERQHRVGQKAAQGRLRPPHRLGGGGRKVCQRKEPGKQPTRARQ